MFCESEESAARVLRSQHPDVEIWPDIRDLRPPRAEVVAGGWPCQDLSIAGQQAGLTGARSGLLSELLRVAVEAKARVLVAENVTNLLRMRNGEEFRASLEAIVSHGFDRVGWRILNAREFGLPQNRYRLIIIASRDKGVVNSLFRPVATERRIDPEARSKAAAGFYWTAGTHSLNYTFGYVPTIKIGSSIGIASPPAVHYKDVVRLLSPDEALSLQGFDLCASDFETPNQAYKAAGNAVARDIGRWVLDGLYAADGFVPERLPMQVPMFSQSSYGNGYPASGIFEKSLVTPIETRKEARASNLIDFLNIKSNARLSERAAKGLLSRLSRSNQPCPESLKSALKKIAESK
jgi:DNA (cytosine-5)-methyltransferase 1